MYIGTELTCICVESSLYVSLDRLIGKANACREPVREKWLVLRGFVADSLGPARAALEIATEI